MSIKAKRFRAQSMTRLLDDNSRSAGELGGLLRIARVIERAQQYLRSHLPQEASEHVFVGGYQQGKLSLITDRAAWLTWLRYEQPRLLELLRQLPELNAITGFTIKVRPVRPIKALPRQCRTLSSHAAKEISSCAADTDDPCLKRSLERLATHADTSRE